MTAHLDEEPDLFADVELGPFEVMPKPPSIATPRLLLRPFAPSDAADLSRLAGERAIADTTLNVPHPYEREMADEWIATHPGAFESGEAVQFAITLRASGELLGSIGLSSIDLRHSRAELGYWIATTHWNQGFCTEAARAVIDHAFTVLRVRRVYANHLPRNPASGRVLRKLGMQHEGRQRQHVERWGVWEDLELYGLLAVEWSPLSDSNESKPLDP